MKFGKLLRRQALGPWQPNYLDYKSLKQIIKKLEYEYLAAKSIKADWEPEDSENYQNFLNLLRHEVDRVDRFYKQQLKTCKDIVQPVLDRVNQGEHSDEKDGALQRDMARGCELLDTLQGYVVLNYLGFAKICKKFDKKTGGDTVKEDVLGSVQQRSFYKSLELADLVTKAKIASCTMAGVTADKEFDCPICLQVLSNPITLSCTHRFCWACLAMTKAATVGECCPVCRKEQNLDPRNYKIDNSLQTFLLKHFPAECPERTLVDPMNERELEVFFQREEQAKLEKEQAAATTGMTIVEDHFGSDMEEQQPSPDPSAVNSEELVKSQPHEMDGLEQQDEEEAQGVEDMEEQEWAPAKSSIKKSRITWDNLIELRHIRDLLAKHPTPDTVFILDLDETLVMSPRHSSLLTPHGLKVFQEVVNALPVSHQAKVDHCKRLQAVLDEKVLVEPNSAIVVKQMQRRGCWVFGLTSRFSGMAHRTQVTMARHGIDFNINSPLPASVALQDPDTLALFCNNIIYTNAIDKGEVLDRFLANVIFPKTVTGQPDAASSEKVPKEMVFVDDRRSNVESVLRGTHVAHKLGIRMIGYHYLAAVPPPPPFDAKTLLNYQIDAFIHRNKIVSDNEARQTTAYLNAGQEMA